MRMVCTLLLTIAVAACGQSDNASFETQEDARRQARENAEFNASSWRDTNQPSATLIMRGDSSIKASCPQGDGWATVDLKHQDGSITVLKCSTVSDTIGCLPKVDFQQRDYAKQDGRCNGEIPFPLPRIVQ